MEEEECQIGLGLGIGCGDFLLSKSHGGGGRRPPVQFDILFPELGVKERHAERFRRKARGVEKDVGRDVSGETYDEEGDHRRAKKTKLTSEQSTLLEDSFRERNTLTPGQKNELAQLLNLRPRQIEVWFQNRRARTKLKQTEVNREYLKTYCESLTDENRRLRKELMELRSVKFGSQLTSAQLQKAARLRVCTACQNMAKDGSKCSSLSIVSQRPNYLSAGASHDMKDRLNSSMTT